ncbi:hypothetical protein BDM02DRAFT_3184916 [Thelephora ganbajun]|uniref:Uncharacterized protein n=1 Tax=Thelephora ganbajun TaxID=370292 RepID=A0ACB6ZN83_THEGA|nr:hypothetical protein BDM02DRAFT_3184916 [Thelephora ganbajun]
MASLHLHPLKTYFAPPDSYPKASGVGLDDKCLVDYQGLKLGHKYKYIIYGLNPTNTEIVVVKTSEASDYEDFIGDLPENECRWAVYDFEYERDGGKRNKLIFFSWSPDGAKTRNKMMFASSKEALRRSLVGIATEIQATETDELAYESVFEKVTRAR